MVLENQWKRRLTGNQRRLMHEFRIDLTEMERCVLECFQLVTNLGLMTSFLITSFIKTINLLRIYSVQTANSLINKFMMTIGRRNGERDEGQFPTKQRKQNTATV